jgi:hypothetical protein
MFLPIKKCKLIKEKSLLTVLFIFPFLVPKPAGFHMLMRMRMKVSGRGERKVPYGIAEPSYGLWTTCTLSDFSMT